MITFRPSKIGFSLMEVILVMVLFAILLGGSFLALSRFSTRHQLNAVSAQMVSTFRRAQANAMARYQDSPWGVYLDAPQRQFILFKGLSYASRDVAFDQPFPFSQALELNNINLQGGGTEAVFSRVTGETPNTGSFALRDPSVDEILTFNLNLYGQINLQ